MRIRPATQFDTGPMAALLNEIIDQGGTTAMTRLVHKQDLWDWISAGGDRAAWHVAESGDDIVGFQWIGPKAGLPKLACDIATFVKIGQVGLGIGSQLFTATRRAGENLDYAWINATIRADNSSGLTYYQSRGFRVYDHQHGVALENGQIVDKVLKRFDL